MKRIVLLGASGSIGIQTIDVVLSHSDEFEITALSIGYNVQQLREILEKIHPAHVCVAKKEDAQLLKEEYSDIVFHSGDEGLLELAVLDYDVLVNALVGFVGLMPTLKAIETGHDIALANKETLVVGGQFVMDAVHKYGVSMTPIDSEHSAIFQCLQGNRHSEVKRLIVTASGGSFRNHTREQLKDVTVEAALKHPNWSMGAKITIDSATMMNKGFEVIEAHWLFGFDFDHIDVVMHPESVVHSMVEYHDTAIVAQLGTPDMRLPIQYALSWPNRLSLNSESMDFTKMMTLHFSPVSFERFPLLGLAYEVGRKQGNLPAVLNAANEVANQAFRDGRITFLEIEELVINTVHEFPYQKNVTLQDVIDADRRARMIVESKIKEKMVWDCSILLSC
ncbi:MAG: 1-deoxy-D-xylulose-5-phosphate reductoisomerase [Erysipelotrichaceae bacterium]|nr:1-deoxy-D-xylulose-5-phosphate reductoisomerase [Erysipelotrichaceae bacterium]